MTIKLEYTSRNFDLDEAMRTTTMELHSEIWCAEQFTKRLNEFLSIVGVNFELIPQPKTQKEESES
mgnify:CR=1 FL=1|tara:strand:- start:539 stop:736 length:198 start_codon:yes stop_codon:yes gene_type:complete